MKFLPIERAFPLKCRFLPSHFLNQLSQELYRVDKQTRECSKRKNVDLQLVKTGYLKAEESGFVKIFLPTLVNKHFLT